MSVQVWQTPRGLWRWRYLEPPAGHAEAGSRADLPSLTDHETAEEAESAALTAYPGVHVEVATAPPAARESRWQLWTGRIVLLVVVVLAVRNGVLRRRGSP